MRYSSQVAIECENTEKKRMFFFSLQQLINVWVHARVFPYIQMQVKL